MKESRNKVKEPWREADEKLRKLSQVNYIKNELNCDEGNE